MRRTHKHRPSAVTEDHVRCQVCGRWFEQITHTHLRLHGMATTDYEERFGKLSFASLGLRRRLSEDRQRLPLSPNKNARYLPRMPNEIITEIRRRSQAMSAAGGWRDNMSLVSQASRVFGSWLKALEAAGLKPTRHAPRKWDRQSTGEALRHWAREHGGLKASELSRKDNRIYAAMLKHYGPTEQAGRALGVKIQVRYPQWSKDTIKAALCELVRSGGSLATSTVLQESSGLYRAACKQFGSWHAAVDAAGFDLSDWNRRRTWTSTALARALHRWVRNNGPLNRAALERADRGLYEGSMKRFGSIQQAAHHHKLPYRPGNRCWTKESLADVVRARLVRKQPVNAAAMCRSRLGRNAYYAGLWHFGSWVRVLAAAGAYRHS